jgi:hypothetical protein
MGRTENEASAGRGPIDCVIQTQTSIAGELQGLHNRSHVSTDRGAGTYATALTAGCRPLGASPGINRQRPSTQSDQLAEARLGQLAVRLAERYDPEHPLGRRTRTARLDQGS